MLALGVALARPAAAATWTVCQDGTCDYETITDCAYLASDADVCAVYEGIYHETVTFDSSHLVEDLVVRCVEDDFRCVIDGDGVRGFGVYAFRGWEIEGFEIRNTTNDGIAAHPSRYVAAVRDCWIHDVGGDGISNLDYGAVVERNIVENTFGTGIGGIRDDIVIQNNLVVNAGIGNGRGISCGCPGGVIQHNTVDVRHTTDPYFGSVPYGIFGSDVRHNVVLGGEWSIYATSWSENNTVWAWDDTAFKTTPGTGDVEAEPDFLGIDDYHLASALPASGSTLTEDLDEEPRDASPDRGAFEYDASDVASDPEFYVDEVVASPSKMAVPAAVHLGARGPAVAWFDPDTDTLAYAVRDGDDSWAIQDVTDAVPPSFGSLDPFLKPLAMDIDPNTGEPVVAWLEGVGTTTSLRFARFVGSGCGSGCDSADWSGCSDTPLLTFSGSGTVALDFDPADGTAVVALVARSGASCGSSDDYAVDLFRLEDGGWTVETIDTGGCTDALGRGLDVSVHPDTSDIELAWVRSPLGGYDGEVWHAVSELDGTLTLTALDLGADIVTYGGVFNHLAMVHSREGDLHLAFTSDSSAGTWGLAAMHRVDDVWSEPEVYDAIGITGSRPQEALALVRDSFDQPVSVHTASSALRWGYPGQDDTSIRFMDVRRHTGWWVSPHMDGPYDISVVYQADTPNHDIRLLATSDPGVSPAGGGLGEECSSDDPCVLAECDADDQCAYTVQDCDDDNECTEDICLPEGGCDYEDLEGSCDDGDPETFGDECVEGVCVGIPAQVELFVYESVGIAEAVELLPPVELSVSEAVGLDEDLELLPPVELSVAEAVGLGEDLGLLPPVELAVEEGVGVGEGLEVLPPLELAVVEAVGIGETTVPFPPVELSVVEVVGVAEDVEPLPPVELVVDEAVGVREELDLEPLPTSCGQGCGTRGGAAGGSAWLLGALVLLVPRRRRARGVRGAGHLEVLSAWAAVLQRGRRRARPRG